MPDKQSNIIIIFKITYSSSVCIIFSLFSITKKKYRTYIVLIKYDKTLPKRFRNKFLKIEETKPHLIANHNGLYEKDMLKWMSYEEVKKFKYFRKWYRRELIPSILEKF